MALVMKNRFCIPLLSLALLLALTGCTSPSDPTGMELTAADSSFAELLADLHAADVDAMLGMEDSVFSPDRERRDSVLRAHNLTEEAFLAMAEERTADPERFVAIYNRALDLASGR